MRSIVTAAVLLAACGTTYRVERKDLPPNLRGATELGALLDTFERAVGNGELDKAEAILAELEDGVKTADLNTITHFDYPRIAEKTNQGPSLLKRKRAERAIEVLVTRGNAAIDSGSAAVTSLASAATSDALEQLEEAIEELDAVKTDAAGYEKDTRWAESAPRVEAERKRFTAELDAYRWLVEATEAVGGALEKTAEPVPAEATASDLLDRAESDVSAFAKCVERATEEAAKPGAKPALKITTVLGQNVIGELPELCRARGESAAKRVAALRWQLSVQELADRVSAALKERDEAKELADLLESHNAAVTALGECGKTLADVEQQPGYVAKLELGSYFGKKNAVALRKSCTTTGDKLAKDTPTIEWRIALADVTKRGAEAQNTLTGLATDSEPGSEPISEAQAALRTCADEAGALAAKRDQRWKNAAPAKGDLAAAKNLAGACAAAAKKSDKMLELAKLREKASN
jgi:hypothetical protein